MFEFFEAKKEIFEDLPHGYIQFELSLDEKNYSGQYRNGYVNWFHPQPDPDNHDVTTEEMEAEVHKIMVEEYILWNDGGAVP